MQKYCPECQFDVYVHCGECVECGHTFKRKMEEQGFLQNNEEISFEENEWTETDWGVDYTSNIDYKLK